MRSSISRLGKLSNEINSNGFRIKNSFEKINDFNKLDTFDKSTSLKRIQKDINNREINIILKDYKKFFHKIDNGVNVPEKRRLKVSRSQNYF